MSDKISSYELRSKDFRYMDETSIHSELKCAICLQCFIAPVSLEACNHTFCNECVHESLKTDKKCPICRRSISADDFKPIENRIVINMLDQLLVQCNHCNRTNISRGDMITHLQQCDNYIVSCLEADLGCPWTGQRKDVTDHLKACVHHQIQPLIQQLYAELERLQMQVKDLQEQQQHLENQIKKQGQKGTQVHGTRNIKKQNFQVQTHLNRAERTMPPRRLSPRYRSLTPTGDFSRSSSLTSGHFSPPPAMLSDRVPFSHVSTPPETLLVPVLPRLTSRRPPVTNRESIVERREQQRLPRLTGQKRGKNTDRR